MRQVGEVLSRRDIVDGDGRDGQPLGALDVLLQSETE